MNCIGRDMKLNLGCGQKVIFLITRFYSSRSSSEVVQKGA